jgi:hypothetical protein
LKKHVKHVALGGILTPIILALAAAIANGANQALNLNLHGTALAIFLVGFVAGATLVTSTSVKAEAAAALSDIGGLGGLITDLGLGDLLGGSSSRPPTTPDTPFAVPATAVGAPPPPPPVSAGGEN